jgi:hypothetical protein
LLADTIEAIKKYVTPEEMLSLIEAERTRLGKVMITNPEPCTLHPEPCTLHPEPCTLHPEPSALNR